ncbi:MAG: ribonuclease P protein component [Candidatus Moranbacteria bacterium CG23_combo_of_CG06-09_8_20_14_all_39_10]|nr:MAG: ribonuclease P protein component [Candidatus Moranbacteria bacterium CG23_combo_of_CG06-09_8_20_14_all_39_10]
MLPFKNRLTKRKDHERVQRLGRFVSLNNIAMKILENDLRETRVGIIAGLKFSKKAVARNQVKRMLSDLIQLELKNISKGLDIVIMARKKEEEKIKSINFRKNLKEILVNSQLLINNGEKPEIKTK